MQLGLSPTILSKIPKTQCKFLFIQTLLEATEGISLKLYMNIILRVFYLLLPLFWSTTMAVSLLMESKSNSQTMKDAQLVESRADG